MTFIPLFGPITKLSLSFITFRVSHFPVSHLTHETFKLGLQNTLNMSKTTRVYFGVLHYAHEIGAVRRDGIRRSAEGPIDEDPYQVEETNYLNEHRIYHFKPNPTSLHTTHLH